LVPTATIVVVTVKLVEANVEGKWTPQRESFTVSDAGIVLTIRCVWLGTSFGAADWRKHALLPNMYSLT
jgi:hypothetical protein